MQSRIGEGSTRGSLAVRSFKNVKLDTKCGVRTCIVLSWEVNERRLPCHIRTKASRVETVFSFRLNPNALIFLDSASSG